jgi:hypothetical protein
VIMKMMISRQNLQFIASFVPWRPGIIHNSNFVNNFTIWLILLQNKEAVLYVTNTVTKNLLMLSIV